MGLCGGKESNTLERPGSGILTVYGDHFSPETRTLIAMINIGDIKHEFHPLD